MLPIHIELYIFYLVINIKMSHKATDLRKVTLHIILKKGYTQSILI